MENRNKYIKWMAEDKVVNTLQSLAEECAELSKESLKMSRALGQGSYTPKKPKDIINAIIEEMADVRLVMDILISQIEQGMINDVDKSREKIEQEMLMVDEGKYHRRLRREEERLTDEYDVMPDKLDENGILDAFSDITCITRPARTGAGISIHGVIKDQSVAKKMGIKEEDGGNTIMIHPISRVDLTRIVEKFDLHNFYLWKPDRSSISHAFYKLIRGEQMDADELVNQRKDGSVCIQCECTVFDVFCAK